MQKEFKKGDLEWNMYKDFYKLTEKFWIPEQNDKYWRNLIDATDDFAKKYKGIAGGLAARLAVGFIEAKEIELKLGV